MVKRGEMANGIASREAILEAIPLLASANGYSPTIREIADEVQLSKSATYNNLLKLVEAGKVVRPARPGVGWRVA